MDKSVKIRVKIDFRAMKYFNMYNLIYRKRFLYLYVFLTFLCVGASIYSFVQATPNFLLGGVFALFAVYLVYQTINIENMIDRNIMNYFYNKRPIEQDLLMTEESITITSPMDPAKTIVYDWVQITSIYEIPQFFYLYIGKHPLIIDKDPNVVLEGDYEDLIAIIMEKTKTKPFRQINKEVVKKPVTYVHQEFEDIPADEIQPQSDMKDSFEEFQDVEVADVEDVRTVEDTDSEDNKEKQE